MHAFSRITFSAVVTPLSTTVTRSLTTFTCIVFHSCGPFAAALGAALSWSMLPVKAPEFFPPSAICGIERMPIAASPSVFQSRISSKFS